MKKIIILFALPALAQTPTKPIRVVLTRSRAAVVKFIEENDPSMKNPKYAELFRQMMEKAPSISFTIQTDPREQ